MRTEETVILTKEEYKEYFDLIDRALRLTDRVVGLLKRVMEENKLLNCILDDILDESEDE